MQPTQKTKEEEHKTIAVVWEPMFGIARILASTAMMTPAYQTVKKALTLAIFYSLTYQGTISSAAVAKIQDECIHVQWGDKAVNIDLWDLLEYHDWDA